MFKMIDVQKNCLIHTQRYLRNVVLMQLFLSKKMFSESGGT